MFLPIGDGESRPGSKAVITIGIIALNVGVFLAETQVFARGPEAASAMVYSFGAIPYLLTHHLGLYWTTAFSSMFLHASWLHLGGNMLFMWIFADNVEDLLGEVGFVIFYLLCGTAALLAHAMMEPGSTAPVLGASGAISGVLGAYIWEFPRNQIRNFYWFIILVGVMRLPAWLYLGVWFVMQLTSMAAPHGGGGIAFTAHVGGFVTGAVLVNLFPRRREAVEFYNWRAARQ